MNESRLPTHQDAVEAIGQRWKVRRSGAVVHLVSEDETRALEVSSSACQWNEARQLFEVLS